MTLPVFIESPDARRYLTDNYVVLDFEVDTTHGDYGHPMHADNQLLLACWTLGPGHPCYDNPFLDRAARRTNELGMGDLLDVIHKSELLVCHNGKYELGWLARCGLDLRNVLLYDTKIAEYVLAGNLKINTSLDACGIRRGMIPKDPAVDIMMKHGINPVEMPKKWLEDRCRQDVETTEAVFHDQRRRLDKSGRLPVLYTRCLLTPVLAATELEGVQLDSAAVEAEYTVQKARLTELSADMDRLTGGINWKSPKQIAQVVYDKLGFSELRRHNGSPIRTASDKPMTDQGTLDRLKATTDEQREFLRVKKEIGKVQARISKALDYFMMACQTAQGVIHAEFNQTVTQTHRLSSSGVKINGKTAQFQNVQRTYKRLFRAKRPGWLICEPDGSQLEFRAAAMLSGDMQAMADIVNKEYDVHLFTASVLHACTIERAKQEKIEAKKAGRDDWRQLAKPDTFKPLYGGEKGTPAQERYYEAFRNRYSVLSGAQESWAAEVRRTGRLRTAWGLTYYWPHAKIYQDGRLDCRRQVFNYPIQAFATAEIIPIAVVYLWHGLREAELENDVIFVNTVHDSVVMEVRNDPDVIEKLEKLCLWAFTDAVFRYLKTMYNFRTDVPLGMGIKTGEHWGDGEEKTFNVWSNGNRERLK